MYSSLCVQQDPSYKKLSAFYQINVNDGGNKRQHSHKHIEVLAVHLGKSLNQLYSGMQW